MPNQPWEEHARYAVVGCRKTEVRARYVRIVKASTVCSHRLRSLKILILTSIPCYLLRVLTGWHTASPL
jgi:hypothetical protein